MNRQYMRSERAHYMCPNMHFAIRFLINEAFVTQMISQTLASLAAAHPFLRALIRHDEETDELYYHVTDVSKIQYRPFSTEDEMMQAWTDIAGSEWNVFETGMLKVFSCPDKGGTMLLFAAHHLLTDGRGLLELICEFADCIAEGKAPMLAEEHLIASIDDLPKGSGLAFISRLLVDRAGWQWQKERHAVIYADYLKFAAAYGRAHPVEYRRDQMDANEMAALCAKCHDAGVSINDWLMAQLYISEKTNKIIIAFDIRNDLPCYHKGALGNYASAMSIVCRTKTTSPMGKAKEVHALMQQSLSSPKRKMMVLACYLRMNPKLLDAAAISALGGFDSKAARFVGGSMFGLSKPTSYSITNLGKIENQHITFVEFIPPASPAARATLGVLTLNGVMRVVTSVYCE